MHFALIIVGTVLGYVFGAVVGGEWWPALLGAFAGYAVAEIRVLYGRTRELDAEVRGLKERLAVLTRRVGQAEERARDVGSRPTASGQVMGEARSWNPPPAGEASDDDRRGPADVGAESVILQALREYFTGGNTLVRVGILILFFGVAFLLRYAAEHSHVPIQFRLTGVACGGLALLIVGWRLRARRTGYALALQGGGVGILYLTTFAALRLYSTLSPTTGFVLLVFLAAFSAALAVWQDSQAFAFLAVTGGFLAPILASTGQGSHVVLFSYYAVLNASILAIAWYKTWRPLNFVGFAFTFLISGAWGVLHYNSGLFASTEPFLVLFFVFYVAIALLFSLRQPPQLRGYVDGTLVFGTPIAAFGYQSGMLHERHALLSVSAVVVGAFYFLLAWVLHRQQRSSQRLLIEAFVALGVVFLTVATPLALSGTATGVTWALEGTALVWIGARQDRAVGRVFGALLQIFAALIQVSNVDMFLGSAPPAIGLYLARAITAVAAVLSAVILRKYADRLRPYEAASCATLFYLGVAEWLFCGLLEIDRYAPPDYAHSISLVFVTLTALGLSELSRRSALTLARVPALWLLPALFLFALLLLDHPHRHPFDYGGWLAWPLAFASFYVICSRHEGAPNRPLANWMHIGSAWLVVGLLSWQLAGVVDQGVAGRGSWPQIAWMLVPAAALWLLPRLVDRVSWPLRVHREAYVVLAGGGVALYLALWSLETNCWLPGDPYPFPYVPLLNALDLAQVLVLAVLARYWLYVKATIGLELDPSAGRRAGAAGAAVVGVAGDAGSAGAMGAADNAGTSSRAVDSARVGDGAVDGDAPVVAGIAALAFVWLNAALIRTLHRWAGVPFDLDAVIRSTLVQMAVSIFWTVLALATMLVATRRASRTVWITGASLLAVTIVKLFVIDLSRVGTVERIVSFVGVGLLTLVIGYVSPLPPAAQSSRTTAS
jgi:uncharacterized membrane protein